MSTTLTLKNVPDDVYARLKRSAETHRRSINSEAILCLETVLVPARVTVEQRLDRARRLRKQLTGPFDAQELDAFKRSGRA